MRKSAQSFLSVARKDMLRTPALLSGSTLSASGQLTFVIFCSLHIFCLSLQERAITVRSFPLFFGTMTSADFSTFNHTSLYGLDCSVSLRPPRISALTFLPYICRIYTTRFGQYRTLLCLASSSTLHMPYMRFLFVRPGVCYCLLSDSTSRWTPLAFANSSY